MTTTQKKVLQEDFKEFQIIYPAYIDKNLKTSEGRRIPLEFSVEKPTAKEIYDICVHYKLKCFLEPHKQYPKDFFSEGRVRVLLKSEGKCTSEFKTSFVFNFSNLLKKKNF
jgi:signal recognition particle subunit SRP19